MSMRNKKSVRHLQKQVLGLLPDGYWGDASQRAYADGEYALDMHWGNFKKYFGRFSEKQQRSIATILEGINSSVLYDGEERNPLYVAYILATIWHETATTMRPIEEIGRGRGRDYGTWYKNSAGQEYSWGMRGEWTYLKSEYNHLYYGRGLTQNTWLENCLKLAEKTGHDYANEPDLLLEMDHSIKATIIGMVEGIYTGRSLGDCISYGLGEDFEKARTIINGHDRASKIAKYADSFLACVNIIE